MAGIESSSLFSDIIKTFNESKQEQFFRWEIKLAIKNQPMSNVSLVGLGINHDYLSNYASDITCDLLVPEGTYHRDVVANENELTVIVTRVPLIKNKTVDPNRETLVQVFRAVLKNGVSRNIKGSTPDNRSYNAADISNLLVVRFQLLELSVEAMRRISVGIIPVEHDLATAIRFILTSVSNELTLPDSEKIRGVDIVDPNNDVEYNEIIIPDGTKLYNVANYLQNRYGVYSAGLGCYLYKGLWYVYPLFDTTRYDAESDTLTIINAPANKFPNVEASFIKNSKETIIIATGEMSHADDVTARAYNLGSGARFTDGNKVIEGFTEYKDGESTTSRENNTVEFISDSDLGERAAAPVTASKITTNAYVEFSNLARSKVEHLMFEWHNADPFLLYPGQPCRFIYQLGKGSGIRKGVLARAEYHITGTGRSVMDKHYSCNAALTILIEKEPREKN